MVRAQQLWRGLCSNPTLTPVGKGLGEPQLAHTGAFLIVKEMQRFLPAATVRETVEQASYWEYLTELVRSEGVRAMTAG